MRCLHVCTIALLAFMKVLVAISMLASHLQLETEPFLYLLALRPTSGHDDQSIVKTSSLRSRDLDQAHTTDLTSLREQIPALRPNAKSHSYERSMSSSEAGLSVSERSLLTDIAMTGFRLIWDYMDITYASYTAFYQTTELWTNMTANARGKWKAEKEVTSLDISYGGLKLSIAGLIDAISWELVAGFAAEMLVLSRILVFVAFRVILVVAWEALVITLAITAQVFHTLKPQQLVGGP